MVRASVSRRSWVLLSRWLTNLRRTTSRLVVMALCSRCPTRQGLLRNLWRWSFQCCRSVGCFVRSTGERRYERFYVTQTERRSLPCTGAHLHPVGGRDHLRGAALQKAM